MRRLSFFLVALLALGGLVLADELTTGTLEGTVTDKDGKALGEAVITAIGPQGTQTTVTQSDGDFILRGLNPGTYEVKAEAAGHATMVQTDVLIYINRRTQLPFELGAGMTETVTVTSEAPIVDLKSMGTGETIRIDDFAPYVPLGRNLTSIIGIAPGVADGGDPVLGNTNSSISGSSGLENAYFVDGVNITNSGYGAIGAYSIVYGSLGTGVTYDFLEEVQIKTGGFEAEFGQAGGGIVNSVVKSGGNAFVIDASIYVQPESLEGSRGDRVDVPNFANATQSVRRDFSISAGGPILKDKLFFFAAYNPVEVETDFKLTSGDGSQDYFLVDTNGDGMITDDGLDTPFNFDVGETITGGRVPTEVTRTRTIDNYAAKLSWFATPNHRIEVTAFGDPSDGDVGPQSPTSFLRVLADPANQPDPGTSATGLDWGGDQYAAKYQGVFTANLFAELQFAHKENNFDEIGPGVDFRAFFDADANNTLGGAGFYEALADEVDQINAKITWVVGPVELSGGYQSEEITWAQPRLRSGDPYTAFFPILTEGFDGAGLEANGFSSACAAGAADGTGGPSVFTDTECYTALLSTTGASVDILNSGDSDPLTDRFNVTRTVFTQVGEATEATEDNIFLQATIEAGPAVTIKLGARWTEQELTGSGSEILDIGTLSDGTTVGGMSTSLTAQSYKFDSEIAPRIGVSWDVAQNGKHKLYANYGEYYQRVPSDLAVRAFSNEVGTTTDSFLDGALTTPELNTTCAIDTTGDGVFDGTALCHLLPEVQGLAGGGSIILDGTQKIPGSDVNNALGNLAQLTTSDKTALPYTEEYLAGYAFEINDYTGVEVRYIHRELGRVLEDVQFASNEQTFNRPSDAGGFANFMPVDTNNDGFFDPADPDENILNEPFPGHGSGAFGAYVFANVGDNVSPQVLPFAQRDYDAFEFIFNRRFKDHWMAYVNYRFARLEGNYEGSFRNDNGQSDPFLTSLFDFPATSAVDTTGDNVFDTFLESDTLIGQYSNGPLNTERTHIVNGFLSRQWDMGLNVGGRVNIQSGQPRGPLFAHPAYQNAGEIPGTNGIYWWGIDIDVDPANDATNANSGCTNFDPVLITGDPWCNDGIIDNDEMGQAFITDMDPTFDVDGLLSGDESTDFNEDGVPDLIVGEATGPRLFDYDPVQRDFFGTTPMLFTVDLHAAYDINFGSRRSRLTLLLDIFNVFNDNNAIRFDNDIENRPGSNNPDFLKANQFHSPRITRLGVKYTW